VSRAPCGSLNGAVASAVDPDTGHCYVGWINPTNQASAQQDCQSRGGDLVSINSSSENALVRGMWGLPLRAWIGVVSPPGTSQFRLVTGEHLTVNDFAAGEPDDADHAESCVALDPADGWHDLPCGFAATGALPASPATTNSYICEISCGNSVVEPGESCDPPGPGCTRTCQIERDCPEPGGVVSPTSGRCFFLGDTTSDYSTVKDSCPRGTHLAVLESAEDTQAASQATGGTEAWFALRAPDTLGAFAWEAPATLPFDSRRYHGFTGTEPNEPTAPACVRLRAEGWADHGCTRIYGALCERD
jgi:hypothetical protein